MKTKQLKLQRPNVESDSEWNLAIKVSESEFRVVDSQSQLAWVMDNVRADVNVGARGVTGVCMLDAQDPANQRGHLECKLSSESNEVSIETTFRGIPASLGQLIVRRCSTQASDLPAIKWIGGTLEGHARTVVSPDYVYSQIQEILLRRLQVSFPDRAAWQLSTVRVTGGLSLAPGEISGQELLLESDLGVASLNGTLHQSPSAQADGEPSITWLSLLDGDVKANLDIARLTQSLPGVLPLREDAMIQSATVRTVLSGQRDGDSLRTRISLDCDPVRAISAGREIMLEPVNVELIARPHGNWIAAEKLHLRSMFAEATAQGNLQHGEASFNVDLGRLAIMLSPLFDLGETQLGGTTSGQLVWSAQQNNAWKLAGKATASQLFLSIPGEKPSRTFDGTGCECRRSLGWGSIDVNSVKRS